MRIVRLANFVTPVSGGVRTALAHLAREYRTRGIDPVLVIPGPTDARHEGPDGTVITLAAPRLPGTSYHVLLDRARVRRVRRERASDALRDDPSRARRSRERAERGGGGVHDS